jgi:hypothetical protein
MVIALRMSKNRLHGDISTPEFMLDSSCSQTSPKRDGAIGAARQRNASHERSMQALARSC